jgi:hypothetical protein
VVKLIHRPPEIPPVSTLCGILIVALSVATLMAFAEWEEWGLPILGSWLAASPWILGFHNATALKINIGIGICVAYLAALELVLVRVQSSPPAGHAS